MSDLIRREDLVKELNAQFAVGDITREIANDILNHIPSAEPERKKGHWTGDCCSCCGVSKYNYIKMVDDECGPFGTWNFCPNCGADMRTKGNENV